MPNKEKTFEEKMNKLEVEDIVHKIDNSEASLDESLKLYFEGTELIKDLEKTINDAKEKIKESKNS